MTESDEIARFAKHLIGIQRPLFVYIAQLVGRTADADDILQEVNRVAWEKIGEFEAGTNVTAWAYKIAYFEVLRYRKTRGRERCRFADATLDLLAADAGEVADREPDRLGALQGCLAKLPAADRDLITRRYLSGVDVRDLAAAVARSEKAVYRALARVRSLLLDCVQRTLSAEAN